MSLIPRLPEPLNLPTRGIQVPNVCTSVCFDTWNISIFKHDAMNVRMWVCKQRCCSRAASRSWSGCQMQMGTLWLQHGELFIWLAWKLAMRAWCKHGHICPVMGAAHSPPARYTWCASSICGRVLSRWTDADAHAQRTVASGRGQKRQQCSKTSKLNCNWQEICWVFGVFLH